ncbi:hypothetical protein GTU99_18085 [Streptomyces sp. PRKS01-65]|nr:hypothetical protein [Streptomyces harenosi]
MVESPIRSSHGVGRGGPAPRAVCFPASPRTTRQGAGTLPARPVMVPSCMSPSCDRRTGALDSTGRVSRPRSRRAGAPVPPDGSGCRRGRRAPPGGPGRGCRRRTTGAR